MCFHDFWVIYRDAIFQKREAHFWDEIPLSLPFRMTSCEVSIIHIIIWRLPFESSSRGKEMQRHPKKMTYPMLFLCRSSWFHPPPNRSRHCDAQTFTSTFDPQKTRLSRGELHHPFCHDVIALRVVQRIHRIFVSWDFYGTWKKGISSLTSFSEHWFCGGAHEISKDAHVPTV